MILKGIARLALSQDPGPSRATYQHATERGDAHERKQNKQLARVPAQVTHDAGHDAETLAGQVGGELYDLNDDESGFFHN